MGISLSKGGEVNLSEQDPGLKNALIGLGWEAPEEVEGQELDLDASAFLLNRNGEVRSDNDFIFYNNLSAEGGAITHQGDNLTGGSGGDDEEIVVQLEKLPYEVEKVAFVVTIHDADERQLSFGNVKNAYIRVVNKDTGNEVARFDLTEDASNDSGMIFGEIVREVEGWSFKAIGTGNHDGLYGIAKDYGVNVAKP